MPDSETMEAGPNDVLVKLSAALAQIARGDPFVALRNEIQTRFQAIDTRLSAMDKATELQHEDMVRVPTLLDKAIGSVRDLLEQSMRTEIAGVVGQLFAFKSEATERFAGSKLAIDAALAAAKEATAKIEAGFTKQIDGMVEIINTKTENLSGSIGDIKDRVVALESRAGAVVQVRRDTRDDRKDNRDNLALLVSAVAVILVLVFHFLK
jgi:hypothetical protein